MDFKTFQWNFTTMELFLTKSTHNYLSFDVLNSTERYE